MYATLLNLYFIEKTGEPVKYRNLPDSSSSLLDNNLTNNQLGYYLAGLIEGDGSKHVPKTTWNKNGKKLYPIVKIIFVKKDVPLALKIKEVIQGGTLAYPKNSNYVVLNFQDLNSIQKIAILLNGKMRTPKIEALFRLIDWLNAKSSGFRNVKLANQPKILKLGLDSSSLGNNAWLSGFIEGDGHFYCGFDLNADGLATQVKCYMTISQKQLYKANSDKLKYNSNFNFMESIKNFLDVKTVNEIKRIKKNYIEAAYLVKVLKKSSCQALINYLNNYPLFSSKYQDFLDWHKAYLIKISRKNITQSGTHELISVKNSMNTKRTQFNWDSLNKFYI